MGFTWPLWDLPGHYGSAIIGCASHIVTCQIPLKIIKETNTVKLEMFADINVCEFVILKVFALLKFAILGLPKVNFVFSQNNVPLLILLIGYIR